MLVECTHNNNWRQPFKICLNEAKRQIESYFNNNIFIYTRVLFSNTTQCCGKYTGKNGFTCEELDANSRKAQCTSHLSVLSKLLQNSGPCSVGQQCDDHRDAPTVRQHSPQRCPFCVAILSQWSPFHQREPYALQHHGHRAHACLLQHLCRFPLLPSVADNASAYVPQHRHFGGDHSRVHSQRHVSVHDLHLSVRPTGGSLFSPVQRSWSGPAQGGEEFASVCPLRPVRLRLDTGHFL